MPERCGARFKKHVSQISDRAKRYRAHSPGCRPDGPKVCYKCGSRRFVVPDHIDGDESNGRKSNLRWACKRHNTILGKKMAKAGKGVRTRQYNPNRKQLQNLIRVAAAEDDRATLTRLYIENRISRSAFDELVSEGRRMGERFRK